MTEFQAAASKLREADAVLIGASNGLSITEGLHLFAANQAFRDLCGDFQDKYGISCLLQGMGAQWPEEEVKWAYWSRLVQHYCREYKKTPVMETLQALVGQKDYFIVTSNGECHFEKSGFDPKRIFEVEGTWLDLQCARACHNTLYPWEDLAGKMAAAETGGRIPTELVPHCPRCGGPMEVHLAMDSSFLPNTQGGRSPEAISPKLDWQKEGHFGTGHRTPEPADQGTPDAAGGLGPLHYVYHHQQGSAVHPPGNCQPGLWF